MTGGSDDLLPEYERELARLRRSLHEFARRHPTAAARLSTTGEHSEDPHVERTIQPAALQFARVVTVYDVVFAPLRIAEARYAPATSAPAKVRLHENTMGDSHLSPPALCEASVTIALQ